RLVHHRRSAMSLTESERHQIIQLFREKLGVEGGELMMKAIAPVGWGDIATNRDLRELEARLEGSQRILAAELRAEMADLRAEMHGAIAELRVDLANGLRMQTYAILGGGSVLVGLGSVLSRLLG
ncbi:MAG: hypothetical protein ACSLFP_01285, partial [Acidimicrobiales bacterium]